jgi:hypothetical protein
LAEFVSYCDTHCLVSLEVSTSDFVSIPKVLAAAINSFLEPEVDVKDDPLWSKAIVSSEREYWIAGA